LLSPKTLTDAMLNKFKNLVQYNLYLNRVKQFEMQGYHSDIEMYRDTSERRNIQKKVGAMPEKYGRGDQDQPFTTYKTKPKHRKGEGRERNKRHTMRYVRNKGK